MESRAVLEKAEEIICSLEIRSWLQSSSAGSTEKVCERTNPSGG